MQNTPSAPVHWATSTLYILHIPSCLYTFTHTDLIAGGTHFPASLFIKLSASCSERQSPGRIRVFLDHHYFWNKQFKLWQHQWSITWKLTFLFRKFWDFNLSVPYPEISTHIKISHPHSRETSQHICRGNPSQLQLLWF